ncbi:MAG TPA: nucleotidyl transferase AbiEii/AbiGii toxin family protein [Miltoncostaeaceae bacterium]|nr:nucleotidyl transferase AbiEii/AbiGii toxin family protein [Miltoncostaeaceae bacterium]
MQVEQDALLSRVAIELAEHRRLGAELAWRGGTCLHKLHLPEPRRYSEDLDYVLVGERARRFAEIANDVQSVLEGVGLVVGRWREITPTRIALRGMASPTSPPPGAGGQSLSVKIEINTSDKEEPRDGTAEQMPLTRVGHEARIGRWWSGTTEILTFEVPALIGSKFRALGQRRKGRDLSDVWLARQELFISDDELAEAAWWYTWVRERISPRDLAVRIRSALDDPSFTGDLDALTTTPYVGYSPVAYGRDLIRWVDGHLGPRHDASRAESAVRRDQQRWERNGWSPDALRCVDLVANSGTPTRCPLWLLPGTPCPVHGSQP